MDKHHYDLITIGGGPAGLAAAGVAVAAGMSVLILEKATQPAGKLLISGGGKGNVTNRSVTTDDYIGENPRFTAEALKKLTPEMFLRRLSQGGIALEAREEGRIFCAHSAKDVLKMLLTALPFDRCRILCGRRVLKISRFDGTFSVLTEGEGGEACFSAPKLIVATGSAAWPQCGGDDSGLHLIRALGHKIIPARPVLVPLVLPPDSPLLGLAGISALARVSCDLPETPAFTEAVLFTHKGLSGPAILQISCYWRKEITLFFDFLPHNDLRELLDNASGGATPQSILSNFLPDRLCRALLPPQLAVRRASELSRKDRNFVVEAVREHKVVPLRTEGMSRAEAAAGGIDTREVDPLTMESKLIPNLFFCGEVLDVVGRLGGYNLHWAWASGMLAGDSVVKVRGGGNSRVIDPWGSPLPVA